MYPSGKPARDGAITVKKVVGSIAMLVVFIVVTACIVYAIKKLAMSESAPSKEQDSSTYDIEYITARVYAL